MKKKEYGVYYVIAAIVIVVAGVLYVMLPGLQGTVTDITDRGQDVEGVEVLFLGTDCEDCFDITIGKSVLEQAAVEIKSTKELTIEESKAYVKDYALDKLPAIVVKGDVEELEVQGFEQNNGALVFSETPPPYYDVETKEVMGKVTVIHLDTDCDECFDVGKLATELDQVGIKVVETTKVSADSEDGKDLIEKYSIKKIPTLIFNKELLEYELLAQMWDEIGSEEEDGALVLRSVNPLYVNVETGEVEGYVKITYLTDDSCEDCYNVSIHKQVLASNFGMQFSGESTIDVKSQEGQKMIDDYGIELVPTIILSEEADAYPSFGQGWEQVGTVEDDGMFVLRNLNLMPDTTFRNLTSGELVNST